MQNNNIICPYCRREFPLTEAITSQIETQIRAAYDGKIENLKESQQREMDSLKQQLEKKLSDKYEKMYEQQYEAETAKLRESITKKIKTDLELELKEKDEALENTSKKLETYRKKEIEILAKERQLEEEKHSMELAYQTKLNSEVKRAYAQAEEKKNEEFELKIREKEKIIDDLNKQMKEGQRKAEQGSMKLQGEILELEIEDLLVKYFPEDEIQPVAPGKKGADILQIVKTGSGKNAGVILWETKRTKNWQAAWIQKLKEDQRREKAELAVIASEVLPANIHNFGLDNGIWISDIKYALGLACALREHLKSVAAVKAANTGKENKAEMVYDYLTGTQFKQRVESVLEAYIEMKGDIEDEKRLIEKSWAKREKQIERFVKNISGMYGDLQGLGAALQNIKLLEYQ